MIVIDTNVLLRYVLDDDELQSRRAAILFTGDQFVYLSHVVLVEAVWTLVGNKYRLTSEDVDRTLTALFQEANIIIEDADVVWRALQDYRKYCVSGNEAMDFQDLLIFRLSQDAAIHYEEPFEGFYTFDKAAQKLPGAVAP